MTVIAMLAWFDEDPEMLRRCIQGAAKVADSIICCDGAYDLFPTENPVSPTAQYQAILETTAETGIGLTLPRTDAWSGNQIEKRQFMLDCALAPDLDADWLLILDADHIIETVPDDLRERLKASLHHAVECNFEEFAPDVNGTTQRVRAFLRAVPGLKMGDAHYEYVYPGNKRVTHAAWAPGTTVDVEHVSDMMIRHHVYERPAESRALQQSYWKRCMEAGIEP